MKAKILVADDMMMDREVLTELLCDEFDVTAVEDGEAAIRELDANPGKFKCVLLDIVMPKVTGFGVLEHMRDKGYDAPVIALTALTDSDGHIRCYEAGVSEILEKPYDRKILLYKVRKMVGGGKLEEAKAPPADISKLSTLEFKLTMLNAFEKDFSAAVEALRKAIAEHDEPGLHDASHTLQGLRSNLRVLLAN